MKCSKYLTTNYDNYLSEYVEKGPKEITHFFDEFINEMDDSLYDGVYNLHGDYTKPSTIVLSREAYERLYGDKKYIKVLEQFRTKYFLLFMGVSLDDEYIQQVLRVSSGKLKARHYILLSNIAEKKRLDMEEEYNVRILDYTTIDGDQLWRPAAL